MSNHIVTHAGFFSIRQHNKLPDTWEWRTRDFTHIQELSEQTGAKIHHGPDYDYPYRLTLNGAQSAAALINNILYGPTKSIKSADDSEVGLLATGLDTHAMMLYQEAGTLHFIRPELCDEKES